MSMASERGERTLQEQREAGRAPGPRDREAEAREAYFNAGQLKLVWLKFKSHRWARVALVVLAAF